MSENATCYFILMPKGEYFPCPLCGERDKKTYTYVNLVVVERSLYRAEAECSYCGTVIGILKEDEIEPQYKQDTI